MSPFLADLELPVGVVPDDNVELLSTEELLRWRLSKRTQADEEAWRRESPCGEPFVWID